MLSILAYTVEEHVTFVLQRVDFFGLLLDKSRGGFETSSEFIVFLGESIIGVLKLAVLQLRGIRASIELSFSLPGMLSDTKSFDFTTGHLMLNTCAVGILDSLQAEKLILEFVMSHLGFDFSINGKRRL